MNIHGAALLEQPPRPGLRPTIEETQRRDQLRKGEIIGYNRKGKPIYGLAGGMDAYYTTPIGPFHTATGAAFTTFTTKQNVSPDPVPIFQGGQLRLGSILEIQVDGEISSTGSPTFVFGLFLGALGASGVPTIVSTLAESSAVTIGAAAAAWPFRLNYEGRVTLLGTAGTIVGQGELKFGTSLTAWTVAPLPITQALRTVTLDTTIARAIGVCGTWSASSASNSVKVLSLRANLHN